MDTIYALSSGPVPSGVAVIRISGPKAGELLARLCGELPPPRRASLRLISRPQDASPIDKGIVIWLPGPRSFTGEDVAELHVHGGRAVLQAVFDSLAQQGAHLAAPGEFTRRAFANGKMDLTEVEGLADLIQADTEVQLRQALGLARGGLSERAEHWRETLIGLRAELEARLDFSDEADVPETLQNGFYAAVDRLSAEMADALATSASGERLRDGFRVAILGRPNAGKSSLLNAVARRDVAIVTTEPGTTRDVLGVPLNLDGYPIVLFDTAGLREAASAAEREGVRRASATAMAADLVLWLEDCMESKEQPPELPPERTLRVATKIDLLPKGDAGRPAVSSLTGEGIAGLIREIRERAAAALGRGDAVISRYRQRDAVAAALSALDGVAGAPDEIAADLLRSAGDAIGRLTGRIHVEDVLDRLFREFCIGK